ncbi:MAG: MBOAT family protein [Bacteroidales bacterium]
MLFGSTVYLFTLPLLFAAYWFVLPSKAKIQNLVLICCSIFLYGAWDGRFLSLMIASAILNYGLGIMITGYPGRKKLFLALGLLLNLGMLLGFKYYDFFLEGVGEIAVVAGFSPQLKTLHWIVPLGLSYYTFQSVGYLVDCYRGKISDPFSPDLFLLLLFFPKIIAGPIERSADFLVRVKQDRHFDYIAVVEGLRQILWGVFKKVVIADNIAIVLKIYDASIADNSGSTILVSILLFSVQIYADFSGYSDIAIGTARLFGIQLSQNFNNPYFSSGIREFWKRWHMSLMTWFRDYLFLPLSYSLSRKLKKESYLGLSAEKLIYGIATFVTFIICGLWHGASWTFITWGLLNALWFLPFVFSGKKKKRKSNMTIFSSVDQGLRVILTFILVTFTWIFFEAQSISDAFYKLSVVFSASLFSVPEFGQYKLLVLIPLMFIIEWKQRHRLFALSLEGLRLNVLSRWLIYFVVLSGIYFLGAFNTRIEFLYFGF